jgi:hypothetical protein
MRLRHIVLFKDALYAATRQIATFLGKPRTRQDETASVNS